MSRRDNERQAAEAARERAEALAALAEQEARWSAREEKQRQRHQAMLDQFDQVRAQDRLEAEAAGLDAYRATAIAEAVSSKTIAPQFVPFITGTSREQIDAQVEQARASTAEIAAELVGEPVVQARDERTGRYAPAEQQSEQIDLERISLEDWAKVRGQFIRTSDRGIFQ